MVEKMKIDGLIFFLPKIKDIKKDLMGKTKIRMDYWMVKAPKR